MDDKILDDLKKKIGIEELINVILVNENVRPAMLIQPADYKEATGADKKTKSILMSIKNNFPNLVFSEKYKGSYQGIIISKKMYDNEVINLDDMGKILGYPCYNDFSNLDREKVTYSIGLRAVLTDGKGDAEIFSNACSNNSIRPTFDKLAMDATNVLKSNKLIKSIIEKVEVVEYIEIPTSIIINKLINNTILNQAEKDKIQNILYNFGFHPTTGLTSPRNWSFPSSYNKFRRGTEAWYIVTICDGNTRQADTNTKQPRVHNYYGYK
jgi:hypothetical protein